jgi:AAA domain/Domain of unknown function (DUF3854)
MTESAKVLSLLNDRHLELLAARGISEKTAASAGLRSVGSIEAKKILGFDPRSGGILIPYIHPATGAVRTYRFRPDVPLVIDGKPAKYLSPRGVGNLLYFPPDVGPRLAEVAQPLNITEGEFKTLCAHEKGILCLGLTGVYGWKARKSGHESAPIVDLDFLGSRGRTFTIIFDSDLALNGQVAAARHALGKELYRRDASVVWAIDLPSPDGKKVGLDDFLVSHGLDEFLNLNAIELPPTDIPPFSQPISALLDEPEEPLEFAIENLQPMGASGFRVAAPKVGKSWDMWEEAFCLAHGQSVYGRFAVPIKRKVLVIEEEDNRRRSRRRLNRMIRFHDAGRPSDEYFRHSIKKGFRLDEPAWREVLEWEIKRYRPDFCYLDVFSRLHAQDPNDNRAMSEIVLFLDHLTRDYGTAFIILIHTRKNKAKGGDAFDEILGARALSGFAEATVFFSRTKEKGVLNVQVSLKDEPDDGFEPEFQIRLTDSDDGQSTGFEYVGVAAESQPTKDSCVFEAVANDWLTVATIATAAKVTKPTARAALGRLVTLGAVEQSKQGKQALIFRRAQKPENNGKNQ